MLQRHHDLWRSVLDQELNAVQSLQNPAPFVWLGLELKHNELDDAVNVGTLESINSA
jgi:hypothetical protein